MSDDIRVYWDGWTGLYSIVIGNVIIHQMDVSDNQHESLLTVDHLGVDNKLVYDSAEDEDYSLIDENLVIPDVCYGSGVSGVDIKFSSNISFGTLSP